MEQKKVNTEATSLEKKKKQLILALVLGVLVLVGGIVGIIYSVYGGHGTPGGMLETFFETKYSENGKTFENLCNCIAPELQLTFDAEYSASGTNYTQLTLWRNEAKDMVGENVKVKVSVQREEQGDSAMLSYVQKTCKKAEELRGVVFHLTLTGDKGYVKLEGLAQCLRYGDDWYLFDEDIPLTIFEKNIKSEE